MKKTWLEIKEEIINALKFTILTTTMTMGFFVIYIMIWTAVGLPGANWAMWILFLSALLSEWLFIKWLSNQHADIKK